MTVNSGTCGLVPGASRHGTVACEKAVPRKFGDDADRQRSTGVRAAKPVLHEHSSLSLQKPQHLLAEAEIILLGNRDVVLSPPNLARVNGSSTTNLSLGERPVRLPVNAMIAPLLVNTPSFPRNVSSNSPSDGRFQCTCRAHDAVMFQSVMIHNVDSRVAGRASAPRTHLPRFCRSATEKSVGKSSRGRARQAVAPYQLECQPLVRASGPSDGCAFILHKNFPQQYPFLAARVR